MLEPAFDEEPAQVESQDDKASLEFLAKYGFTAANGSRWHTAEDELLAGPQPKGHPQLVVHISGHDKKEGHTFYNVDCALSYPTGFRTKINWTVQLRLCQFQKALHDPVKHLLGSSGYQQLFSSTPFAHRGGPPGTTARLDGWCTALSRAANTCHAPPRVTALFLQVLEIPEPVSAVQVASSTAASAAHAFADRFRSAAKQVVQTVEQAPKQAQQAAEKGATNLAAQNPQAAMSMMGTVGGSLIKTKW